MTLIILLLSALAISSLLAVLLDVLAVSRGEYSMFDPPAYILADLAIKQGQCLMGSAKP